MSLLISWLGSVMGPPHKEKHRLNMRIIVQTQAHIFRNDWELEFDGLEPLTVGLPFLIDLEFG